jgi:hypothetical protein
MDGRPELGCVNVLADECAIARQGFGRSVKIYVIVRHLASRLARKDEQRRNTAVDVHPAVSPCRAGIRRQGIELFLVLHEKLGQCLQHFAALMEGQLAQICAADGARVIQDIREVQTRARYSRHGFATDGAGQGRAATFAGHPLVQYEIAEFHWSSLAQTSTVRYKKEKELKYFVSDCTVRPSESKSASYDYPDRVSKTR